MFLEIEGRGPSPDLHPPVRGRFGAEGGRIGRHHENNLALPDPTRQISRHHVEVRCRGGQYSVKVISETNGILVNDAFLPPGASMELADGDRLLVGEYELRAHLNAAMGEPAISAPPPPGSVFAGIVPAVAAQAPAASHALDDILRGLTPAAAPAGPSLNASELDDLLNSLAPLGGASPMAPSGTRPTQGVPSAAPLPPVLPSPAPAPRPASPPPRAMPAPAVPANVDDIFGALNLDFAGLVGGGSELDDPFNAPLLGLENPSAPPDVFAGLDALGLSREPSFGGGSSGTGSITGTTVAGGASPGATSAGNTATRSGFESTATVALPGQGGPAAAHLLRLVSDALQLDAGTLDETRPEESLEMVGQLLRLSLEGVHRLLEMRATLKEELRVEDRTTHYSRGPKNPLKSEGGSLKQATAYLVDLRQHNSKLFMPPAEAVEDAMWDICSHEMALMAGMRAALLASLKMFSPDVVEGRIKKSGALSSVLPQFYKSKLWDQFLAMYADLQREAEDHFDHLLNEEFSKAYGEQSKKLRRKSARVKPEAGGKR